MRGRGSEECEVEIEVQKNGGVGLNVVHRLNTAFIEYSQ
jgi:hypothetical protein